MKVPVGSVGWISVVVVSALTLPTEEEKVLIGPPGVRDVRAVTDADADAAPGNDVAALTLTMSVDARAEPVSMGAEKASSSRAVVAVVTMARERSMAGRLGSIVTDSGEGVAGGPGPQRLLCGAELCCAELT